MKYIYYTSLNGSIDGVLELDDSVPNDEVMNKIQEANTCEDCDFALGYIARHEYYYFILYKEIPFDFL